ncbi:MAG: MlaD family protein [Desulfosalsimonadaceae bacterium]|nr:MlaD family protein [Desulfosalsimonadaceae bacterium]
MTEENSPETGAAAIPEAVLRPERSFSIIWLVPLVAALIGGWLVYKTLSEKGPEITITFKSAEGLEAGKTKIKYKEVEVGVVSAMSLSKDLSNVVVSASLSKGFEAYLTDRTRFWVVKPRISAGEVSGLGTLFAGSYISVDPNKKGKRVDSYTGLDRPPIVTTDLPGQSFVLRADRLGSLDTGSPIYYRQLRVGEVESYALAKNGKTVDIKIFVHSPYDRFVLKNTRFWNAGGLDFSVDANGLKVDTESIVSIVLGGIAFDTPVNLESSEPAKADDTFMLYGNHKDALKKTHSVKDYWIVNFTGSVRGLSAGAPVEFRGIRIGQVLDINLKIDAEKLEFSIPVLIEIEPESLFNAGTSPDEETRRKYMASLVATGLRAQLKAGNLLTGQLFVDLNFYPDAPPQQIARNDKYPELPSIQTPMEEIVASIAKTLDRINKFPLEEVGADARAAVQGVREAMETTKILMQAMHSDVRPKTLETLKQTKNTLVSLEKSFNTDSSLNQEAKRAMEELAAAARSIRVLVDYIERNPDAMIYGKGKDKR